MTILTRKIGTFLQVDRVSLLNNVERALDSIGVEFHSNKCNIVSLKNGSRIYAEYKLPGLSMTGPRGESMHALLKIQDSDVPGMALKLSVGVFRLMCLNGLYGMSTQTIQRMVHRPGPVATFKLNDLSDAIKRAIGELGTVSETAQDLADTPVHDPIDVIGSLNVPDRVKRAAIDLVTKETYRAEDSPFNAWGLYNLINEVDRLTSRGFRAVDKRDEFLAEDIQILAEAQAV